MLSAHTIKLLALSKPEVAVIEALQGHKPLNISSISRATRIPRTSLYTTLSSLKARGVVSTDTKGKSKIVYLIHDFSYDTNPGNTGREISGFQYIRGKDHMFSELVPIYTASGKSRVYTIQPTATLVTLLEKFNANTFIPINEIIKKNGVIVESIVKVDALETYLQMYKNYPKVQKDILQSFYGRMNHSTFVGTEYFNCDAEIVFNNQYAYICNWKKEIGIKIYDRDILELVKELFTLAQGYGKKEDLNKIIKEKLDKLIT